MLHLLYILILVITHIFFNIFILNEVIDLQDIIMKTLSMKHENKTYKSIYNILTGKKTHQTYFDATIEHLKLYYGCLPNLKYADFEKVVEQQINKDLKPIVGDYFYHQATQTVGTLLLLIQMVSQRKHEHFSYQPIINDKTIQFKAKELYISIKDDSENQFITEVHHLFEDMNQFFNEIYVHYLLAGYRETPYTTEQIALLEDISIIKLKAHLVEEYQFIQVTLQNEDKYPILSQIKFMPKLHQQTLTTYQLLNQTYDIETLARLKNVKSHTIHDHVIEMYIKGYLTDKNKYIDDDKFLKFVKAFEGKPNQNLKYYYEALGEFTYFEIKLMYVIYAMEGLNVTQ